MNTKASSTRKFQHAFPPLLMNLELEWQENSRKLLLECFLEYVRRLTNPKIEAFPLNKSD